MFIYVMVSVLAVCDAAYWWWADRRLRPLRRAALWRAILAVLAGGQLLVLSWWILLPWTLRGLGGTFWVPVTAWLYMWHLLILPLTVVCLIAGYSGIGIGTIVRRLRGARPRGTRPRAAPQPVIAAGGGPGSAKQPDDRALDSVTGPAVVFPTRRQVLGAAAALVPQALLGGSLLTASTQNGRFRVRRFSLAYSNLPKALDGLTIAHVSDTHAGRFVREPQLERIAQETLDLHPDLILFTGDLIDFNLADLPPAVGILRQLNKKVPLAACVGNHDLFESASQFRRRLHTAEIPLLTDEKATFTFRGQRLDVLGLDWGTPQNPRKNGMEAHIEKALGHYSPSTFSIMLAHHPHAFDGAAAAGVPLTLAGHTHGGQLMLTESVGAGNVGSPGTELEFAL